MARITVNVVREPKANQEPILSSGSVVWHIKLENIVFRSPQIPETVAGHDCSPCYNPAALGNVEYRFIIAVYLDQTSRILRRWNPWVNWMAK